MSEKIVLILLVFENILCFNVDTDFPIVYKDPSGNEGSRSYFGYSVAIYPGHSNNPEKWIRIGAPQENDTSEVDSFELGTVYNCPMDNLYDGCSRIHFPKVHSNSSRRKEIRRGHWIGGTMDISYEYDRMLVCGFRRHFRQPLRTPQGQNREDYRTIGGCYHSNLNNSAFEDVSEIRERLLSKGVTTATTGESLYFYGQGESGFSAHFSTGQNEFILGAPGLYDFSGGVLKLREDLAHSQPISKKRRRSLNEFICEISPQNYSTSSHYDLLGYAVTSGYFYGGSEIYYAVSSPKGVKGSEGFYEEKPEERLLLKDQKKGKVLLLSKFEGDTFLRKERLLGEQYGAYYGQSLTAGRVNKDSYDDLVVGAPFYKENIYNEGRAYLYLGDKDNLIKSTVLKGTATNGQFGSSVMYLGDLDNNGYGEVAVSAPYEDDNGGVVYIFKGQDNGLHTTPYQKIVGKQILPNIRGFGIGISKSVDMDENNFKDFAVGAPLSGHAVFLRTRPIVVITSELQIPNALENKEQNFTLKACFNITEYEGESINIAFKVNVDVLGYSKAVDNFIVMQNSTSCQDFNVSLELKNNFLRETSFIARLSYALIEPTQTKNVTIISNKVEQINDHFCKTCPVLDKFRSSPLETQVKINIVLECGDDKYCESNLIVKANIPEVRFDNKIPLHAKAFFRNSETLIENSTFVVGSSKYLTLEVEIKNTGENAYGTNLQVFLPSELQFTDNLNGRCTHGMDKSTASCHVDNPLKHNATKLLILHVDMDNIYNFYTKRLLITFNATTVSNDTKIDSIFNYTVQLKHADILLFGWSEQDYYYYTNEETNELLELTHTFRVGKTGYSPLKKLKFKVDIPHILTTTKKHITFLKLHEPYSQFKNLPMVCVGDFEKDEHVVKTAALKNDDSIFSSFRRKKRSTISSRFNENIIEVLNNTLFLNCSMNLVKCSRIECSFGPFEDESDSAEVEVKMTFNVSALSEISSTYDMILISTIGKIDISSPKFFKQTETSTGKVVSTALKKIEQGYVALWIILLAIFLGLLLLVLIIIGLIKMGFFKRKVKEEMDLLKLKEETESMNKKDIIDITDDQEIKPEDPLESKPDLNEDTDNKEFQQTISSREGLIDLADC